MVLLLVRLLAFRDLFVSHSGQGSDKTRPQDINSQYWDFHHYGDSVYQEVVQKALFVLGQISTPCSFYWRMHRWIIWSDSVYAFLTVQNVPIKWDIGNYERTTLVFEISCKVRARWLILGQENMPPSPGGSSPEIQVIFLLFYSLIIDCSISPIIFMLAK